MRPLFADGFANPELARRYGLDRFFVVDVPAGTDTPAMATAVAALVDDVQTAGTDAIGEVADVFPNDPEFSRQWSLFNNGVPDTGTSFDTCPDNVAWCAGADIRAPEAWSIEQGSPDVIIAIIDSGVYPHVEFADRLLLGKNTVDGTTDTIDGCPHGTHVAGIAAAAGNEPDVPCPTEAEPGKMCGVAGVNWNAKILPVKVLGLNGQPCRGSANDLAEGITWAVDHGATVLNISLQFYDVAGLDLVLIENALNYATDAGALVIAAAGNGQPRGPGVVAFPAVLPQAMAVSATTACDELATVATTGWKSNFGPELDIAAPGDDIYSTWTFNNYRCLFGTSMATPHVVGVASLIMSNAPELTVTSVRNILTSSSVDLGPEGWDEFYGYGRLDAYNALLETQTWPQMLVTDPPSGSIDARRPHLPDNRFAQQGWHSVRAQFRGDAARLTRDDFSVGASISAPTIAGVDATNDTVVIQLDGFLPQGTWTTISHMDSGTQTKLGVLPGDVNGDAMTTVADLDALQVEIAIRDQAPGGTTGATKPLPAWSTDINRSGATTPADLIELIDLMNGARAYDGYLNARIPPAAE